LHFNFDALHFRTNVLLMNPNCTKQSYTRIRLQNTFLCLAVLLSRRDAM
jgi:hypothetical protein